MVEPGERAGRCDDHRQPLAPTEPLTLEVAVQHHQRVEPDRAVVDEDTLVHFRDVDAPLGARRDQLRRRRKLRRDRKVAREVIERPERQDAEPRLGPGQSGGSGADRAVAAADDDQRVPALGKRAAGAPCNRPR